MSSTTTNNTVQNGVPQIDVAALFRQASVARNFRDDDKQRFQPAVDFFYEKMLSGLEKRVGRASRAGKTSCVLYRLDLEGYSWKAHQAELEALGKGELLMDNAHYAPHFYGVKMNNGRFRQISIKDLWHKNGLRRRVEDYFFQRDSDGNVVKGPDGKTVRTATVFMKHTKQKHEDGSPIKGVWFFVLDWGRPREYRPRQDRRARAPGRRSPALTPSLTPSSESDAPMTPSNSTVELKDVQVKKAVETIENGQVNWANVVSTVKPTNWADDNGDLTDMPEMNVD